MVSLLIQINLNKSPLPNEVMEQAMRFALWGMIPAWPLVLLWLTSIVITVMRLHIAYAVSTWYAPHTYVKSHTFLIGPLK
jgi:hypothetical protein